VPLGFRTVSVPVNLLGEGSEGCSAFAVVGNPALHVPPPIYARPAVSTAIALIPSKKELSPPVPKYVAYSIEVNVESNLRTKPVGQKLGGLGAGPPTALVTGKSGDLVLPAK
jgi:hypothetical protein